MVNKREMAWHLADELNIHEIGLYGKFYFFGCVVCNPEMKSGHLPSEESCAKAKAEQCKLKGEIKYDI